ncbi:hypothetical protein [Microbulbifer pacificus]|uniref:Uncharacterized protein n=1 Tax=Microbulbifer pacificus TaxID=407164 RepID=A0AAU0MZM1_9GAMM|nr:hypothetical protein [Microbulbifer pacificus]WOX05507.1 hypothetical protein R5R33_17480 [Microbulbifer pacificus]
MARLPRLGPAGIPQHVIPRGNNRQVRIQSVFQKRIVKLSYVERFIDAIDYTRSLGLKIEKNPIPLSDKIKLSTMQNIFQLCGDALYHYGYQTSENLAGQCTPVHLMLQSHLKSDMNIDSFITVGDRYWADYIYCEMSKNSIESELKNPSIGGGIKAHVWLTLTDGTILDCTAEAHADLLFKRGLHPAHKCIMLVDPNQEENVKIGYHRPYLIGTGFLEKTGIYQVVHP